MREEAKPITDHLVGKTVFMLDEIDLMSQKDPQKNILYLLSSSSQNYIAFLLSNNPKFFNSLDVSTQSTQPGAVPTLAWACFIHTV
jgi:DNA polymerase III delta prime subunit